MKADKYGVPQNSPAITISFGLGGAGAASKYKGEKGQKTAKIRKQVAGGKLKKALSKMHESWSRKSGVAGQYRDELGTFIDGMEE
jgi:hypothetical protein